MQLASTGLILRSQRSSVSQQGDSSVRNFCRPPQGLCMQALHFMSHRACLICPSLCTTGVSAGQFYQRDCHEPMSSGVSAVWWSHCLLPKFGSAMGMRNKCVNVWFLRVRLFLCSCLLASNDDSCHAMRVCSAGYAQCVEPFPNSQQSASTASPDSPELHLQSKLGTPAWAPELWLSGLSIKLCCCSSTCVVCPFHCAWSNHICYEIGLKAQNKIGLKLLGGSMLLGCFIHLFWRNTCIFWMEEEVWFAGLWCELCEAFIFETVSWSLFWNKTCFNWTFKASRWWY